MILKIVEIRSLLHDCLAYLIVAATDLLAIGKDRELKQNEANKKLPRHLGTILYGQYDSFPPLHCKV